MDKKRSKRRFLAMILTVLLAVSMTAGIVSTDRVGAYLGTVEKVYAADLPVAPQTFGLNMQWEITDDGELIIQPKTV